MSKYTLLLVLLLLQGRQDSTLVFVSRFLLVFFSALFSIGNCSFPVGHDPGDADYMSKLLKALNPTPPGWSENTSFCQWNGVNCTQPHSGRSPRVNAISLPSSSLSGELPQDPGLNSLSQLTHLDLRNNSLSGPIPSLAGLDLLETVYLGGNNFASIPDECFQGLTALQTLSLSNNPILTGWSFPTELVQSRSLRTLELAHTKIVGELPAGMFDWFPSLQSVDLSSNEIGGSLPESLGRSRIRHLRLNDNYFKGPIPDLSNCTNLSDLQLVNNYLTGLVPPSLMALPSLQNVALDSNYLQGPIPVLSRKGVKATWGNPNRFCRDDPGPCDPRVTTLLEIAAAFGYPLDLAQSWQGNYPCEKGKKWACIDCEGGKIVTVNFGQRNYSGTVSPAFANLTSLRFNTSELDILVST